jgi:stearoyl-CoA desaturase (delta-9 desaturase)
MKNIFKHHNLVIILMHHLLLAYGLFTYGFNIWIALAVFAYAILYNVVINGQLIHLRMAHGGYKDGLIERFATLYSLVGGGTGSPLGFAYVHRMHHRFVDTPKDPHSPKYLGKFKVWFLLWRLGPLNPSYIKDYVASPFQMWMHRHWTKLQLLSLVVLWIINPLIVVFIVSPTVVATLHFSGFINVRGHWYGEVRNIPEIMFTQPASWKHKVHHDTKYTV